MGVGLNLRVQDQLKSGGEVLFKKKRERETGNSDMCEMWIKIRCSRDSQTCGVCKHQAQESRKHKEGYPYLTGVFPP